MADQEQQIAILPEVSDVVGFVARGAGQFARRHKIVTGSYLLGIAVLLFFSTGIPLTLQQRKQYERLLGEVDMEAEWNVNQDFLLARSNYYRSKGFFTCDKRCQYFKGLLSEAEQQLKEVQAEGEARRSDAKKTVGIFSEVAVEEAKMSFWDYFYSGKQFAKRQSMWDAMFMGIRSMRRDESWMEYFINVLIQVLANISVGLVLALVMFVFGLISIVRSFQPNPIYAVIFFVGASCAAFALVASYLLAVYGAAFGSVYGLAKLAETSTRARIAQQHQQQRIPGGDTRYYRPHSD